ncbi:reverse transcriptase [Plakobranchus ocellatus]|uniref:Reverse transcriptase n=1 Tax=Plakobranchus ocellatus TaxID=259542 RepID=A0AAV3ZUL4_9GAST|nr:reverse transcriptase [Plakobranchus ocellatus]
MEVLLKAAERSASPAEFGGECYIPSLKAFIDDTTILCSKEDETRRMLVRLDALMNWSRMSFKLKKSRSLSVGKGKLDEDICFKVVDQSNNRGSVKSLLRATVDG